MTNRVRPQRTSVAEEAVRDGEVLHLLVGVEDGVVGGEEAVVEALDDRHGEDDEAVLVGLEGAAEEVGDVPDDGRLFGDVGADGGEPVMGGGGRRGGGRKVIHAGIVPQRSKRQK